MGGWARCGGYGLVVVDNRLQSSLDNLAHQPVEDMAAEDLRNPAQTPAVVVVEAAGTHLRVEEGMTREKHGKLGGSSCFAIKPQPQHQTDNDKPK